MGIHMATYDLIERLNSTFREMEHELLTLTERLQACRLLAARVFTLPEVAKAQSTIRCKPSTSNSISANPRGIWRYSTIVACLFSSSQKTAAARRPFACRGDLSANGRRNP